MKILQINCVYKYGSTGKIVANIHEYLKKSTAKSMVFYGRGEVSTEDNVYKVSGEFEAKIHSVLSRLTGVDFGFSPISTNRVISAIKRERPDVVHLHCLNGHFINVYGILEFLKKSKITTVLTLHAEIMHTAGCEHAMDCEKWKTKCKDCHKIRGVLSRFFRDDAKHCFEKMAESFSGFQNLSVVGVSDWLTDRAKQSPMFDKNTAFFTIYNGIDTAIFTYTECQSLREKLDISVDKKVVLHVTPNFNHPIKGGKYILALAREMPEIQFVIVGFNGDIENLPHNIICIGHTNNQIELAKYYSMADVTLLTSKRETFSMVVAESLSCGTPVVGFEAGGPETIAIPEYSMFVNYGDIGELKRALTEVLGRKTDKVLLSDMAKKGYDFNEMAEKYFKLYKSQVQ